MKKKRDDSVSLSLKVTRIMKITPILILVGVIQVSATTYAQEHRISVSVKNGTFYDVVSQIERQSEFMFFYKSEEIDGNQRINLNAKNKLVSDEITKNNNLTYKVTGKHIIITKTAITSQITKEIVGVVTDERGEPIVGANVVEKGTSNGTITDLEGKFSLTVSEKSVLIVSYIGYNTQDVTVTSKTVYNIQLEEDSQALDEVVVVGYGTQKKVNLTGSVASVSSDEIKDRVQTDVLSSIQGTVPGVTIVSRPGKDVSINFRGRGNLGTSEPLYVIDGAIADATFFSNLDPNSIESISFLKDAASSAIYGSRAAYGVVLVTTKQGKDGRMEVSYSGMVGMKAPTYTQDLVNSWEYAELYNEALYNTNPSAGKNQGYSDEEINLFRNGTKPDLYPNTNWVDLLFDDWTATTKHSLNFSGGTKKLRYFAGLGYVYDTENIRNRDTRRYNLNLNVASDVTDWLTFRGSVKYIQRNKDVDGGTPSFDNILIVPSTFVARQSTGEWGSVESGHEASGTFVGGNPLRAYSTNDWSKNTIENSMYELGFDLKPLKDLVITGQGTYKSYEYKNKAYVSLKDDVPSFLNPGTVIGGTGNTTNSMEVNWKKHSFLTYTGMANYSLTKNIHSLSVLAGVSYEHYQEETLMASRQDFPADSFSDLSAGATSGALYQNGSSMQEYKMFSYFGRINYTLMDRYLFEANFRADASSRFYADNRWGYFPSFSMGWRISEEPFMKSMRHIIDNLKFRVSYGTLGNINNVGNYDYFQNYNLGSDYNFNDEAVKGILESKPANLGLGWETVALTDFGVDIDLFDNKLSIVADYYIKNTSDILLGYNVPVETGIWSAPSQNIGKVKNTGFEMALTYRGNVGDLKYTVTGNIATNKNKVVDLAGSDDIISNGGDKIRFILREGEPIGSFYGYKTDGLYTQEEIDAGRFYTFGRIPNAGDIKYVPQREDVKYYGDLEANEDKSHAAISGEDRTIIGKDVPDFTYGVNLNLQWKNFELSVFGQGVSGTMTAFESEQISAFMLNANPREFHRGRWTQENPNPRAIYPRIYGGHSLDDYNQYFSDYQLFDSDYFRIKSISLGYMVPINVVKSWGLSSLKLFVTGENLFTLRADDKMKDFDPESPSGRGLSYLGSKSVAFGVNVSF